MILVDAAQKTKNKPQDGEGPASSRQWCAADLWAGRSDDGNRRKSVSARRVIGSRILWNYPEIFRTQPIQTTAPL
jgi:hypothetical protein